MSAADARFPALVLEEREGGVRAELREIGEADLPEGDVTVEVAYSTLNYKDGMILKGLGRMVRRYPHVPGVDFAGNVLKSASPRFRPGDGVLLTGYRVGEAQFGGYAARARVKSDWLVKLPAGMDARRAMAIGTAGFTAMLAVMALEEHGLEPEAGGEVLVTGASGGLGSVAVALLAGLGHRVAAATGRPENADYLRALGAAEIVPRAETAPAPERPLLSERWAGAIDSVGGTTLARALASLRYHASCAACGLAGGNEFPGNVLPFLLRGVNLLGVDSVMCAMPRREEAWRRLARDLPAAKIDGMTREVGLRDLPGLAEEILAGRVRGRIVVDPRR
ncbi:MAG: oxidoreductase [Proteobacteria bacterium]|nr:oxidoreductase [Pseudomonadota bacterium]